MSKRWMVGSCVVLVFAASAALAASAHFLRCSAKQQGYNEVVSFKEAGLGNETTNITVSADATANYACYNKGGKNPSATNKRTVNGPVSASGSFTPRYGSISGSLSLTPPGPGDFSCPSGQRLVLDSVSYANVQVTDTTHNITCTP